MADDLDKPKRRKRGNGEGSVYQRKDGLFVGTIMVDGKRKTVSSKSRPEANRKLTRLKADLDRGLPMTKSGKTVAQFLEEWLETVVKVNERPRTYEAYSSVCRVHLIPALGKHRLEKLTQQHVQAMLNAKRQQGLAPRTLLNIRAVLRIAMNQAMRWDLVARNVVTLAEPPTIEPYRAQPLSVTEAQRFLEVLPGHRLEALFVVALTLGMRQGEVFGLRWDDVDLAAQTLTVRKQLQWVGQRPKVPQLVETKTERSRRTLTLPNVVSDALRRHRTQQLEERLLAGGRWQGEEWNLVFCTTIGTPLDPSNVTKQYRNLLKEAGLKQRRFHDLRHSAGSFLAASGVHPRVAMQILGHSQISTTMNIYTHVELDTMREATARLGDLLGADKASS